MEIYKWKGELKNVLTMEFLAESNGCPKEASRTEKVQYLLKKFSNYFSVSVAVDHTSNITMFDKAMYSVGKRIYTAAQLVIAATSYGYGKDGGMLTAPGALKFIRDNKIDLDTGTVIEEKKLIVHENPKVLANFDNSIMDICKGDKIWRIDTKQLSIAECWDVQIFGIMGCVKCPVDNTSNCDGVKVQLSGENGNNVKVPIAVEIGNRPRRTGE
jgi:hypothetical protein